MIFLCYIDRFILSKENLYLFKFKMIFKKTHALSLQVKIFSLTLLLFFDTKIYPSNLI